MRLRRRTPILFTQLIILIILTILAISAAQVGAQPTQATPPTGAPTVATVNGTPIPVLMFQQRVRFARWTSAQQLIQIVQSYGNKALTDPNSPFSRQYRLLSDPVALGQQVLDSLIVIRLVKEEATRRNISLNDDEVQQQIFQVFGAPLNATPVPAQPGKTPQAALDPTELDQAFQANRDNYFGQVGFVARMTQADVIDTFAEQALQIKLFNALTANAPAQAEQIRVRHILVDTSDKANALLAQIKAGGSFADLAKANSLDTGSAPQGGELGWTPKGAYVSEFDTAIWNAKPGDVLGPIKTQFGYHLIQVEGREMHALSPADLGRMRDTVYRQWLQQARASASIVIAKDWQTFIPADPTLKDLGLADVH